MLSNLEGDLNKFTTGPYADLTLRSKRGYNDLVNRTGVPLPQWDTAGVAAHENFNKQATQLAQQQFTALGGTGTDQQLGSAFKANPNDALSDMGNRQIVALLKGNEDAIQAMNTGWQNWKKQNNKGDDSFPQFQQEFMRDFSPRAFQWVRMSPADRAQMATEMKTNSPGEFVQLRAALTQAEQHGWIKKNSVQAPNAGQ
jgi:hypothetical protein